MNCPVPMWTNASVTEGCCLYSDLCLNPRQFSEIYSFPWIKRHYKFLPAGVMQVKEQRTSLSLWQSRHVIPSPKHPGRRAPLKVDAPEWLLANRMWERETTHFLGNAFKKGLSLFCALPPSTDWIPAWAMSPRGMELACWERIFAKYLEMEESQKLTLWYPSMNKQ
jgi:hypothetical protein